MAVVKEIVIKIDDTDAVKGLDNIEGGVKDIDKSTDELQDTTKSLTGSIDKMTGGLITGFRNGISGIKKGVVAMKSLKVAIAATGIGLLVIAVGSLVAYFTQTQRGADLISKAFAGIGATVSVLIDRISGFGEGLALIFSGKYSEGAAKLKASVKGIGEEIAKESKAAFELEDALNKLEEREIKLIQVNAKRKASIQDLRLAAEDEKKSNKERADALREAGRLQNLISDDEIAIAKERARISQEQVNLGESTREEIRANEELQSRVIELEGERSRGLLRLQTRLNAFTGTQKEANEVKKQTYEEFVKESDANLKRIEAEDERRLKEQEQDAEDLALYESNLQTEEDLEIATEDARLKRLFDAAQKEILIEEELQKAKDIIRNTNVDSIGKAFNLIGQLAGKNKTLQGIALIGENAVAIARNIIATQAANQVATAEGAALAIPTGGASVIAAAGIVTANNISSALSIGASVAATAQGLSALGKGGSATGGGGGSSRGGNIPKTEIQAPDFNVVGTSGVNQLADVVSTQAPVKAYVVSNDVTTTQALDRNIETTAVVG